MQELATAPKDVSRASEVVLDAGSSPVLGSDPSSPRSG